MKRIAFALALALSATAVAVEQAADAESEMARADEYMKQRNWQAAIAHYNAAKLLAPDRPGPYRGLGMALYAAGQCAEAIAPLEEYLRLKGRDAWPQAARALDECRARVGGRRGGTIHVASDPSGALVRIDDADGPVLGSTPFDSESLTPGTHRIYLSRPNFRPTVSEVQVARGLMTSVQVTLAPIPQLPVAPPPSPREPVDDERRRELEQYEQSSSVEQQVLEQVRVRYQHEKVEVCGSGPEWKFCTAAGPITENDFIRRYEKITKQKDLHHALKMRNNVATAVWATIGLAGVGVMAYGLATLTHQCTSSDMASGCMTNGVPDTRKSINNDLSEKLAYVGGAVQLGTSLIYLVYGLKFDGTPTNHILLEYDARNIVDRYNRALERKIRQDLYLNRQTMEREQGAAPKLRVFPTASGVLIQF